jgi:hypothetical protein
VRWALWVCRTEEPLQGVDYGACFELPAGRFVDRLADMGAKYLPTIKDLKASQRFQQKQKPLPQFKKSSGTQSAKKSKKK